VVAFCNRHGILVESYAPVGDGDRTHMRDDPVFPPIAAAHSATIGQVILAYDLASGADIVIPRSATPAHQRENLQLFNVGLSLNQTEIAAIESAHPYAKAYHTDCQPWC
jgi:2,5-diketo-D-gluconate reductase A